MLHVEILAIFMTKHQGTSWNNFFTHILKIPFLTEILTTIYGKILWECLFVEINIIFFGLKYRFTYVDWLIFLNILGFWKVLKHLV
jgi:hypothetical protein